MVNGDVNMNLVSHTLNGIISVACAITFAFVNTLNLFTHANHFGSQSNSKKLQPIYVSI